MDPDPEPDPTPFFVDFKDAYRYIVGYQARPFHFLRSCTVPVLLCTGFCVQNTSMGISLEVFEAVLGIRIPEFLPLTNGSGSEAGTGSDSFLQVYRRISGLSLSLSKKLFCSSITSITLY
jgi:hypothetical protein